MAASARPPTLEAADLARVLELRMAERDRALRALDALERVVASQIDYSSSEDQAALREARSVLEESGYRAAKRRPTWTDRR